MSYVLYNWAMPTAHDLTGLRSAIADRMTRCVFTDYNAAHGSIFTAWSTPQQKAVINIKYGDTIYAFELDGEIEQKLNEWVEKIWAMEPVI
jgi:hypothetical protein